MMNRYSASRDDPDYNPLDLHIFWKNVDVSNQNEICIKLMISRGTTIEEIIAIDSIVDDTFLNEKSKINILQNMMNKKHTEAGQLHYKLQLGLDFRISLTTNIWTKDGLVNGSMGTIKSFTKTSLGSIHIIWIELDNWQTA